MNYNEPYEKKSEVFYIESENIKIEMESEFDVKSNIVKIPVNHLT